MSYAEDSWNTPSSQAGTLSWPARLDLVTDCARGGAFEDANLWLQNASSAPDNEKQLSRIVSIVGLRPECVIGVRQALAWYVAANPESATARLIQARHTLASGDAEIALAQYRAAKKRDRNLSDPDLDALLAEKVGGSVVAPKKAKAAPQPVPPKRTAPQPVPPKAEIAAKAEPEKTHESPVPLAEPKRRPQPVPAKAEAVNKSDLVPRAEAAPAEVKQPPSESPKDPGQEKSNAASDTANSAAISPPASDGPALAVTEGEMIHAHEKENDTRQKVTAAIVAIAVHVGFLLAFGWIVVSQQRIQPPQLTAHAEVKGTENTIKREQIRRVEPPSQRVAAAQAPLITSRAFSELSMPSFDKPVTNFDAVGLGDGFGASFATGMGKDGGSVSFFGSKSVSKKVVFVVDFSASMTGQRDELMRKELSRSLQSLPNGVQYQVICFSGPAWYAGQEVGRPGIVDGFGGNTVTDGNQKHVWYEGWSPKERHKGDNSFAVFHYSGGEANLPRAGYITATRTTLKTTVEQIEKTPLVFGTDWRWPLMMAMNMKPDTIYFMTDGAFTTEGGVTKKQMIDNLLAHNRKNSNARINTVCMMVLQAREELEQLSDATRGELTIVDRDGSIIRARDLDRNAN